MKEQENIVDVVKERIGKDTFVPEKAGDSIYTSTRLTNDFGAPFMLLKDVLFDVNGIEGLIKSKKTDFTPEEQAMIADYKEFDDLVTNSFLVMDSFINDSTTKEGTIQVGFNDEPHPVIKKERNKDVEGLIDTALPLIEKNMSKLDPNSYRYKVCKIVARHIKLAKRPDYHEILGRNSFYNTIYGGVAHLPGADFVNEDGSRFYDFEKYEKLSKDFPQIDIILNEQDFLINNVLPYEEAVAQNTNTELVDAEFKEAYINHYLKQTKLNEVLGSKTKEEVIGTKSVKYTDYNAGWVQGAGGSRYTVLIGELINEDIAFLNSGWEPGEIPMLRELEEFKSVVRNLVKDKADPYFVKNGDRILEAIDDFLEAKVRSEEDRIILFRDMKPHIDKYIEYRKSHPGLRADKLVNYEEEAKKYTDFALASELEAIDDLDKLYEFSENAKTMNQARANRIKKLLHVSSPTKELKDYQKSISDHTTVADYTACGFTGTADNRNAGVFMAYLMGVKNLDYDAATNLKPGQPGFEEAVKDFDKFLKDNAFGRLQGEARQKAEANMVNMFKNAAVKFNSFTFPDIDYTDVKVMDEYGPKFTELCTNMINITQEYEKMVTHIGLDNAQKYFDGKRKEDVIESFYALNGFGFEYLAAYAPQKINEEVRAIPASRMKYYGICAANRVHMSLVTSGLIRGKKVSEMMKNAGVLGLYESIAVAALSANPITKGAKEYVLGKSDEFAKEYMAQYRSVVEEGRLEYNSESGIVSFAKDLSDVVNKFGSGKGAHIAESGISMLLGNALNSETLHKAMEYNEDSKVATKLVNDAFRSLYGGQDATKIYDIIGITDPIDLIKIGGKTPKELWGDEYAHLPEEDKTFVLKARVVSEMILGKTDITVDTYIINENNEMVKAAPYKVAKSQKTIDNEISFFKGISDLHAYLDEMKKTLVHTQEDPDANFSARDAIKPTVTGSDSYKKMTQALNKCLRATDLKDKNERDYDMSYEELESSLRELKAAAFQYDKSHDTGLGWLVSGYTQNGKDRIAVAKNLKDELDYKIESLKDLSYNIGIKRNKNIKNTSKYNKLKEKWGSLKNEANTRKVKITDASLDEGGYAEKTNNYTNSKRKDELRRLVMGVSGVKTKDEVFVEVMDNPFEVNAYEVARKYIRSRYLSKIRKAETGIGTHKIDDLSELITSADFKDVFNEEVKKLAENEVFADMVKKNSKTAISEWNKTLDNDTASRFENLAQTNDVYKGLVNQHPKHAKDIWLAAEDRLENWKRIWNKEEARITAVKNAIRDPESPYSYDHEALLTEISDEAQAQIDAFGIFRIAQIDVVADILAYSLAKDNSELPEFMGMVINDNEIDKVKGYIKKGLEEDVFEMNKSGAEVLNRLEDFDALKITAKQYVKDGLDKEKALRNDKEVKNEVKKEVKKGGPHM